MLSVISIDTIDAIADGSDFIDNFTDSINGIDGSDFFLWIF